MTRSRPLRMGSVVAILAALTATSGCKKKHEAPHPKAAAADAGAVAAKAGHAEVGGEGSKGHEPAAESAKEPGEPEKEPAHEHPAKEGAKEPTEPEKEPAHDHAAKEAEPGSAGSHKAEAERPHGKPEREERELPTLATASSDLKDELTKFTTIAACVTQKSNLEPMLNDALLAIGYDTIVQDTCRVLEAAKARDVRRCEAIEVSGVREFCQSFAAKVIGDPDLCPWVSLQKPSLGRDPFCVAIAGRDKKLCVATDRPVVCEALATRDDLRCAGLGSEAERKPCEKLVERWHTVLTAGAGSRQGTLAEPKGRAEIVPLDGHPAMAAPPTDLSSDLARGIVLVQQMGGYRVELAGPLEHGANFIAPMPLARSRVALELFVMDETHQAIVENIEVTLAGNGSLATPAAKAHVTVKVKKFEPVRSGTVEVTVEGKLTSGTRGYSIAAEYTTFVRDVVKAEALAGARAQKKHAAK